MITSPLTSYTPRLFPHAEMRDGQKELVNDIYTTLTQGKILLAHAPTGLGKTASALAVAIEVALQQKKRIFFLTNRHTQHRIAIETIKMIREKHSVAIPCIDLIGKKSMCSQEVAGLFGNEFNEYCKTVVEKGECEFYENVRGKKSVTIEAERLIKELKERGPLHTEELIAVCKEKKLCSYEVALSAAKEALVIIGDYNYVFNPFVQQTLFTKLGLELEDCIVIVDEGHNLPTRMMDMMSSTLTTLMIKNAVQEAKKFGFGGVIQWLQELQRLLVDLADKTAEEESLVPKSLVIRELEKLAPYDHLLEELETAADEVRKKQHRSYLGGIQSFLNAWKGEDKGYARIFQKKEGRTEQFLQLSYWCLDPGILTKSVFSAIASGVMMSGTLKPTFMYKDILGVEKGIEKEYQSPFPPENKLTIVVPETSTKYTLRNEAMYRTIAEKCATMSEVIPGNVALFFPSYDLRDRICYFLETPKKKFWEKKEMNKEEKEALLAGFREERKKGGVLLGVSGANFAEGIDFPGDLLNGVVIVGLPLSKPDLRTQEMIKYYDELFGKGWDYGYTYPAMNKCFQSAGRCIRSETDKGAILFLDGRFV
ncbi:TPA: ATP-dependent DNA helicase, partial [Candidatus Woesearchaeota archaeon]|nr:ATP-dependent DNA helicase [Candidatus Woesearchaeota archaeon]